MDWSPDWSPLSLGSLLRQPSWVMTGSDLGHVLTAPTPAHHRIQDLNQCWILFFYREGDGTPLQCSCLENPMDGGAWKAAVHGVAKSPTRLRDFTFTFHFPVLEREMTTHSSVLAWRIPGMGAPGGLPSMESHRVRHD